MSPDPAEKSTFPDESHWMRSLADFLNREDHVEALRVDPERRTVSVATLGPVDAAGLQARLEALLETLDREHLLAATVEGEAALPGAYGLHLSRHEGRAQLEKPSCPTAPHLWQWREFSWPEPEEIERKSREEWQTLAIQAGICGVALVAAAVLGRHGEDAGPGMLWLSRALYLVAIVAGGWDAAGDAWEKLKRWQLDIHFLMLAVAAGAVSIGAWNEGALLLFLFSMSGALEHYAMHRTHREINALTKSAPKTAKVVMPDGSVENRPVARLQPGDVLAVLPDETFATDGTLIEGESAVDESNLTGESKPVPKVKGDTIYSGTLNLWGSLKVEVTRAASESALQKIVRLIQSAQHLKAPSQRFTDKFGTKYTWGILIATAVMFFVWWLALGVAPFRSAGEDKSAFYRAMMLLVVASPCALVLSIPSAILASIAWGARRGILFRGGAAVENLALVDTVALDKTGTLTSGELKVGKVESFPEGREQEILAIALTLERHSNHPIARAIVAHAESIGVEGQALDDFRSFTGKGVRGKVGAELSYLGRRELMERGELGGWMASVPEPPLEYTEVWVVRKDLLGRILLKDQVREQSRPVLAFLRSEGIHTLMLTGDRRGAAEEVAKRLGVEEVRAGLHPEDKVEAIRELGAAGRKVAMVGDGVNDAPSLAAAFVSVAMGGKGSDAALEQSDVVLMNDKIEKLVTARFLSQKARAVIRQNLVISLGTVLMMVTFVILGLAENLTLGVLAHEGSTVLVCLNSLRLLFVKEPVLNGGGVTES
jgi:Cd2+/Zn2+-exporting ATPase